MSSLERPNGTNLAVLEYGGTGRSGKGTIVAHLAARRDGIATEETGADYRAVTLALLRSEQIKVSMPPQRVRQALSRISLGQLTDYVARRPEVIAEHGLDALYGPDVQEMVSLVSPINEVRVAVKDGFTRRVRRVRDDGHHDTLLVDGRNLAPVVAGIENVSLVMRTFVSCLEAEAALRECDRLGIAAGSDEFFATYDRIMNRNLNDASRDIDPVRPDGDAINYWHDRQVFDATVRRYAEEHDMEFRDALMHTLSAHPDGDYGDFIRVGAGGLAAHTGRQIDFETAPFRSHRDSKGAMLRAAEVMFDEAEDVYGRRREV